MALTIPVSEIVEKTNNPLLAKHESWGRVLLGDIATVQNGFAFKSSQFTTDEGMPVIRIRDVGKEESETNYVGEYDPAFVVRAGDLLVGMDGDFNCARWRGPDSLLNQRVCRIILNSDDYHPKFLDYALPGYLKAINDVTSSVTVKHLSSKNIKEIPLPLPPMEVQKRIVAEIEKQFSRLDEAVANLKRVKANLKRYKAAVLKAAVEGKLTEEWRKQHPDVEPADKLLERILAERREKWQGRGKYKEPAAPDTTDLPELPEGWVWASPSQLSSGERYSLAIGPFGSNLKVSDYKSYGVPLVFVRNIRTAKFGEEGTIYVTEAKANELVAHKVSSDDLLITKMGDPPGEVCLYPQECPDAVITADCIKLRLSGILHNKLFFLRAIESRVVQNQILGMTKGVAQLKISLARFAPIGFPLPPLDEQNQIVAEVERQLSIVSEAEIQVIANLSHADRLRQSILKKAFFGSLLKSGENLF